MELARAGSLVVLAIAACGSTKRGDAPNSGASGSGVASGSSLATGSDAAAGDGAADLPTPKTGDLQVRVEWQDVPVPMRASPGRTPCNTARAPAVAPTTTWGIPDVLVVVAGTTAAMTPQLAPAEVRVVLADCALAPRIAIGTPALVESATERPAKLTLAKRGDLAVLDKLTAATDGARTIQLPIAGHAARIALDAGAVYELAAEGRSPETAWLVAAPNAGVTEPNGQLLVKDLVPGTYAVTAWLPPRAGGAAQLVRGSVEVVAGDLAELTLELQ